MAKYQKNMHTFLYIHSIVLIARRFESKSLNFKAIEIRKCRFFGHKTDHNIAQNPQ